MNDPTIPWQADALTRLQALLEADHAVLGLVLFGSALEPDRLDATSDLDLLLVVAAAAVDHYAAPGWLANLGDVFAYEQHSGPFTRTLRAALRPAEGAAVWRFDVVITTEAALAQLEAWPQAAFADGYRVLFTRLPGLDAALSRAGARPGPPAFTHQQLEDMANGFYWKGIVAAGKAARGDLLIAQHLCLDLGRDLLVLGMILRDQGQDGWQALQPSLPDGTPAGTLAALAQVAAAFDALAARLDADYWPRAAALGAYITTVRALLP